MRRKEWIVNNKEEKVKSFLCAYKDHYIPIRGNSMFPFLTDGQKEKASPIEHPLKWGKCYVFLFNNSIYVHRLLKIEESKAVFIGDNTFKTETVPLEAIIGELNIHQDIFFINSISIVNTLFYRIMGILPLCNILRKFLISQLVLFERKIYERKI